MRGSTESVTRYTVRKTDSTVGLTLSNFNSMQVSSYRAYRVLHVLVHVMASHKPIYSQYTVLGARAPYSWELDLEL